MVAEVATKVSNIAAKASTVEAKVLTVVAAQESKVVAKVSSAEAAVASNVANILPNGLEVGTRSICLSYNDNTTKCITDMDKLAVEMQLVKLGDGGVGKLIDLVKNALCFKWYLLGSSLCSIFSLVLFTTLARCHIKRHAIRLGLIACVTILLCGMILMLVFYGNAAPTVQNFTEISEKFHNVRSGRVNIIWDVWLASTIILITAMILLIPLWEYFRRHSPEESLPKITLIPVKQGKPLLPSNK